jgi:hypothetical protein
MKRFSFPLDSYRDFLRSQLDAAEARLAELRGVKKESLQAGDTVLQRRQDALDQLGGKALDGGHFANLDAWRSSLAHKVEDVMRVSFELDGPIEEAAVEVASLRRRIELIDRLRQRRLSDHRRIENREAEQLAAELYLGSLRRRGV